MVIGYVSFSLVFAHIIIISRDYWDVCAVLYPSLKANIHPPFLVSVGVQLLHSPLKVFIPAAYLSSITYHQTNTSATGFSKEFPGIKPHLLTLASNFKMPFYRDMILALGVCSVSKQSCSNILKAGPGQAITIVVGGAAESLSAHPGTADLTLRRR
jgi:hypothetical protein